MMRDNVPEVKNPMRVVALRMMGDGGLLQETAPLHSVELSQSAAQAKEAGCAWATSVKVYGDNVQAVGDMARAEIERLILAAKVLPL